MPYDQVRTENYLRHPTTGALRDNTIGFITPQTARDEHVSTRDYARVKSHRFGTSSNLLTIDCLKGDLQEIQLNHSITALTFSNRGRVNLIWPNTDLQHSNWIKGADATITVNAGTDPVGTNTAYRITIIDHALHIGFDAIQGVTYTGMYWFKENGVSSGINLGFATSSVGAPVTPTPVTPTSLWARYQHSWVADATATRYWVLDDNGPSTVDVLAWRPQVYASDTFPDTQIFEDTLYDTTSAPAGDAVFLSLILKQDGTGNRTVTWPTNVLWPSGVDPVLTLDPNAYDLISLVSPDGGARWFGVPGGTDFA